MLSILILPQYIIVMNFRQFIESNPLKIQNGFSQNTVGTHNDFVGGAILPSTWTGSEDLGTYGYGLPSTDITIPNVTRTSVISSVSMGGGGDTDRSRKKNKLIRVGLKDGTEIWLTIDDYNRFNSIKKIEKGQPITVTFQRNPGDQGPPSRVIGIS
jgi:hypothetical protein